MTELTESKASARGRAVVVHLGVICVSFLLSMMIAPATVSFDPEGSGAMVTVLAIAFGHAVALIVGLFFSRPSKNSCTIVFCIAFAFTGIFSVEAIVKAKQHARYMKYQAPYDRFRDWIASPMPKSVSNLRFLTMEEQIEPNAMLEFDIDPKDMDSILGEMKLVRKEPGKLFNPDDFFRLEYYAPIPGDYHVYQDPNLKENNYVRTIKVSPRHDHAIFRSELGWLYTNRRRKPDVVENRMRAEALDKLKAKYERGHGKVED